MAEKKEKSLAVAPKARKLAWGGVMPKPTGSDPVQIDFCNKVAEVYGVPSMGVNVMGNQPYLNKDGLLYLLNDLRKGKQAIKAIRKEFIQLSTSLDTMAVVKATLVFKDGVEIEAIGEASKDNVKLEAVKKTLNLMAETRAINRAIRQAITGDVWVRVAQRLEKANGLTDAQKQRIATAGTTSYEEMERPPAPKLGKEERMIAQLCEAVDKVNDVTLLQEYADKLATGEASERVKKEVGAYIGTRIKELEQ